VKFRRTRWRTLTLLAALALMFGIPATASMSYAATSTGWISLGNLSATPSAVDVYVYSSGSTSPQLVLPDVVYGTVSSAYTVNAGGYTVKMLTAGAPETSAPVWSTSFTVQADHYYTVVPLRTSATAGGLKVLDDSLTAPAGKSLVRVVLADVSQQNVTFHCSCAPGAPGDLVTNGLPGSVSQYITIKPGPWVMTATGPTATGSAPVPLTADTVHTEVVVGGPTGGVEIVNLIDAVGSGAPATGGVGTGFGGTAPRGPASPLPWLMVIGVGVVLTLTGGGFWFRRTRGNRPATQA
jgi:hypothetical protein